MKNQRRQFGLTLTELLVTVAIAAVLMAVAVPAARRITESMRDSAGARALIGAALNNARAIAVREGRYAGVRFQRAADGRTYMVFIINDEIKTGLVNGYCAVVGRKPIALPDGVGVLDGFRIERQYHSHTYEILSAQDYVITDLNIMGEIGYLENRYFEDTSTFSIIFSPSGKIIRQMVWVRNQDGVRDSTTNTGEHSYDRIFNKKNRVDSGFSLLYQDDYDDYPPSPYRNDPGPMGIGPENSRMRFIIYSKDDLAAVDPSQRVTGYLGRLNPLMVSPYTGELIGE